MDNASSPEPNETEAQEHAPPVEMAEGETNAAAAGAGASDEASAGSDEVSTDDAGSDGSDGGGATDDVGNDNADSDAAPGRAPRAASAGGGAPPPTNGQNIASPTAEKKWYIVNTYSGHENKAKLTLLERVKTHNLTDYFGDVLVPTESVTENVKGQRRTTTRKFFPGYMFVQMVLDDRTFHLVKNTPKITGFLGGMKPTPVPANQIQGVQTNITEGKAGKAKARVTFEAGESVRVVDGPFANFSAKVVEVKADKQKLKVSLSMLGRATLVELDFAQVEKA